MFIILYPSWGADQVWFDFAWEPMRTQADVDALSAFMRTLGRVTGQRVELSHEGRDEDVFAAYHPITDDFGWTD